MQIWLDCEVVFVFILISNCQLEIFKCGYNFILFKFRFGELDVIFIVILREEGMLRVYNCVF